MSVAPLHPSTEKSSTVQALGLGTRLAARTGRLETHTSGEAPNALQGNLVVVPKAYADDFESYCRANPQPCPLLAITEPGSPHMPILGDDLDIRTDLPGYRIWREGSLAEETADISALWRDDLVGFAIGCSFSFEAALIEAGIGLRHIEQGQNVPMFVTGLDTKSVGPFSGKMVVSMRPIKTDDVEAATRITATVPNAHGAPLHAGDPAVIGVTDIATPHFGDAIDIRPDETPVFWACGVTPQVALQNAKLPLAITHRPGAMLVTDRPMDWAPEV